MTHLADILKVKHQPLGDGQKCCRKNEMHRLSCALTGSKWFAVLKWAQGATELV